jgi:hypothetical protein
MRTARSSSFKEEKKSRSLSKWFFSESATSFLRSAAETLRADPVERNKQFPSGISEEIRSPRSCNLATDDYKTQREKEDETRSSERHEQKRSNQYEHIEKAEQEEEPQRQQQLVEEQ